MAIEHYFTEDFTLDGYTYLSQSPNWYHEITTFEIEKVSGKGRQRQTGGDAVGARHMLAVPPDATNGSVSIDITRNSTAMDRVYTGVFCRRAIGLRSLWFRYNPYDTRFELYRTGQTTLYYTYAPSNGTTFTVKLEAIDNDVVLYLNDTPVITTTVPDVDPLYPGIETYRQFASHYDRWRFDNFVVMAETSGGTPADTGEGELAPISLVAPSGTAAGDGGTTTLTSTELGATGRYITFDAAAFDNLGSQTIMSRCRPTGSGGGGFGYIYGKTPSGSITGPRFFVTHNSGAPYLNFSASSTGRANYPACGLPAADSVAYNVWQDLAGTWDGGISSTGLVVYVDGTNVTGEYNSGNDGIGAASDDSADPAILMNRTGLGREFVGDIGWIAVWDRVLSGAEMTTARTDGPLEVPTGLVLLWANQEDLGPNGLTPTARSTYVAGALPPNTALGGTPTSDPVAFTGTVPAQSWMEDSAITPLDLSTYFSGDFTPFSYAVTTGTLPTGLSLNSSTGVISGTPTTPADPVSIVVTATDDDTNTAATNAFSITITVAAPAPVLREDYERSSVNLSGSSVTGTGDDAVVTIKPRMQETEAVETNPRWLEPSVRVDNVDGYRPSFKFIDYAATAAANKYHGAPWQTTRRPMFSYDRLTWHYFANQTITASEIQFRHDTAFTADTVYIGRSRQVSVTQVGEWLEGIAAAHPTKVAPTTAAAAFTPTLTSWPAQSFISDEYSSQTDELGRTIPATPLWEFEIDDPALGSTKRLAVMTAGVHAGEDHSDVAFQRAVEHLLGNSAEAIALRTAYRFLVYPMINAPGRAGGGWRGSFTQGTGGADDANRNFLAINGLEIVSKPRGTMATNLASEVPDWHIDWHGAYSRDYGLYINTALDETFRTRASTESGETVEDMGTSTNDSLAKYFKDTVGCVMAITLEHGDETMQSDADLVAWGGAVIRTLESMREDGLFYSVSETASGALAPITLAAPASSAATTTAASGALAALSITAPAGASLAATSASGDVDSVSLTAPDGDATGGVPFPMLAAASFAGRIPSFTLAY